MSSGTEDNAIIMRAGATSELTGGVDLNSVKIIQDAPGIARGADGPLVTPEIVIVAPIPLISTGTDANVQVRGVSKNVLEIRRQIRIVQGRMFTPGLAEVVVGRNANISYSGLTIGNTISLGSVRWKVVGVFDSRRQLVRFRSVGRRAHAGPGIQPGREFLSVGDRPPGLAEFLAATARRSDHRSKVDGGCHAGNRLLLQAVQSSDSAHYHSWWRCCSGHGHRCGLWCSQYNVPAVSGAAARSLPCALARRPFRSSFILIEALLIAFVGGWWVVSQSFR